MTRHVHQVFFNGLLSLILSICYINFPCNLTQMCTEIASAVFRLLLASRFWLERLLTSQRTSVRQFMTLCYFRL